MSVSIKSFSFTRHFIYLVFVAFLFTGCGGAKINNQATISLNYLDEYIIPKDMEFENTLIGGLSDLDYDGTYFYTVVDSPKRPFIYKFSINIEGKTITDVVFKEVIEIDTKARKELVFDSEGLNYNPENQTFTLSSEGSVNSRKDPFIADIDSDGTILETYSLPEYFLTSNEKGLRNNGAFEGLTRSVDGKGIWMATELPMISDGPTVKLYKTTSPVRFTYFDTHTKKPVKQFAYQLGRLRKMPLLPFGINGVSGITEIAPETFLVIERGYSAGHGNRGNRIIIYLADAKHATNTLNLPELKSKIGKEVIPAEKTLIFDFNTIRKQLKHRFADNIEGIVFGPKLANGNQSLLLISDNNFNVYNEQINQIILMEVIQK